MASEGFEQVSAQLVAVIAAVEEGRPRVLTTNGAKSLPAGPLQREHRSMQEGMRAWVTQQTGCRLGFIEQLYTFADRDRGSGPAIEVSYLGLSAITGDARRWPGWYDFFPWEDRRESAEMIETDIAPELEAWSRHVAGEEDARWTRCAVTFGLEGRRWIPEHTLARYELLYEAGLVPESPRAATSGSQVPGLEMHRHHRRILATGIARLRAKIQYQPVIFELMPDTFTLSQLQATVEAIAGQRLHTQNFRRLVAQQELVEDSGEVDAATGGRPARLMRFRRTVLDERAAAGTKLPSPRE